MYKSERAVLEYTDLEDMFPIRGFQRNIVDIATVETIPHREYISIEQLKDKLRQIDLESISYYQNNKVLFCKAPTISWNDVEGVYTQIVKRIYFTRNALIHSKSGKNRERYKPYKDEKSLQKEIPLVRVIAEMIIINSSRIV